MTDDTDDLDEFARMFGAKPQTPPDGLLPPPGAAPADPLAWLLSDEPTVPPATSSPTAAFANPSAAFATATALAEPTQVLPTRRSVAAEAARAAHDTGRRNLIILASIGAVVLILIIVLIFVLVGRSGRSGSPDAITAQTGLPSQSSRLTPSASPTPTPSVSETPTPTPTSTPTQPRPIAPPSPPTVSASVSTQPNCSSTPVTLDIAYTSANAATLNLTSSDGTVNTNITPAATGTIPAVPYLCGGGATYTLTVYSSAEGVTPAVATVTPVPNS